MPTPLARRDWLIARYLGLWEEAQPPRSKVEHAERHALLARYLDHGEAMGDSLGFGVDARSVQRARAAERLWYANGVTNTSEIVPDPARSTMYQLLLSNYDFAPRTGAATSCMPAIRASITSAARRWPAARSITRMCSG